MQQQAIRVGKCVVVDPALSINEPTYDKDLLDRCRLGVFTILARQRATRLTSLFPAESGIFVTPLGLADREAYGVVKNDRIDVERQVSVKLSPVPRATLGT